MANYRKFQKLGFPTRNFPQLPEHKVDRFGNYFFPFLPMLRFLQLQINFVGYATQTSRGKLKIKKEHKKKNKLFFVTFRFSLFFERIEK